MTFIMEIASSHLKVLGYFFVRAHMLGTCLHETLTNLTIDQVLKSIR